MELTFALTLLSPQPLDIDQQQVQLHGALGPTLLPLAWMPPSNQLFWHQSGQHALSDVALIGLLLHNKHYDEAWQHIRDRHLHVSQTQLRARLYHWMYHEQQEHTISSSRAVVFHRSPGTRSTALCLRALEVLRDIYQDLPWPHWVGPLLVNNSGELSQSWQPIARHALPIIAIPDLPSTHEFANAFIQASNDLIWQLIPQTRPWPQWLIIGTKHYAQERLAGRGPSPRAMWRIRRKAGPHACLELLRDKRSDARLAIAVVAKLLHPLKRKHFAEFLDALQGSGDAPASMDIVYKITHHDLCLRP